MTSIQDKIQLIQDLNLDPIINKMVSHQDWTLEEALEAAKQYRNWLILTVKYDNQQLPPSEEIDEVWHNHILDTQKYRADCERIFGGFRDHYPYFGIDDKSTLSDLDDAFAQTNALYAKEFGEPIYEVRIRPLKRLKEHLSRGCRWLLSSNPTAFKL